MYFYLQLDEYLIILSKDTIITSYMKNSNEPNLKTETFSVLIIAISFLAAFYFRSYLPNTLILSWTDTGGPDKYISWTLLTYIWPIFLSLIYGIFLSFPYLKINIQEGVILKKQWHEVKELSLSFFFTFQVISALLLFSTDKLLIWALPILLLLFLTSLIPTLLKVLKHRKINPITR